MLKNRTSQISLELYEKSLAQNAAKLDAVCYQVNIQS